MTDFFNEHDNHTIIVQPELKLYVKQQGLRKLFDISFDRRWLPAIALAILGLALLAMHIATNK